MKLTSLEDLFVEELKDLYDAEKQMVKALPKMAKAASHPELQSAFEQHLKQTKKQVERLEQIFAKLGESPKGINCEAMKALIEEGEYQIKEDLDPGVRDAGLIAAAQKVEHYEIAGYGCVRTYAERLGYKEAAGLLEETLKEEESTDKKLTALATGRINEDATPAPLTSGSKYRLAQRRAAQSGSGANFFLLGLGVGAGVAMLFAPKSGQETRDLIAAKAEEGKEYLTRQTDELRNSANEVVDRAKGLVG